MHKATLALVGVCFDSGEGQPLDPQQQRARIVPPSHLRLRTLNQARDLTFVTMTCLDNSHDHRGHGPRRITTLDPAARLSLDPPTSWVG